MKNFFKQRIIGLIFCVFFLIAEAQAANFSGIIAVASEGQSPEIVAKGENIQMNSTFCIGSLSEQFTAFLVQKHIANLSMFVTDVLTQADLDYIVCQLKISSLPHPPQHIAIENLRNVTLAHLMMHASGYDFLQEDTIANPGEIAHHDPLHYVLLGVILEKMTRRSYGDLLQKLFNHVNMQQSSQLNGRSLMDIYNTSPEFAKAGKSYLDIAKTVPPNSHFKASAIVDPAIGIISTAHDLLLWLQYLTQKDHKNLKKLTSQYVSIDQWNSRESCEHYYGLGLRISPDGTVWQSDRFLSYKATLAYSPNTQKSCVILENAPSRIYLLKSLINE